MNLIAESSPAIQLSEQLLLDRISALENIIKVQDQTERETSRSLAREKELNETKSRFVSIASHEFRTYLTRIYLSASLIKDYQNRMDKEKITSHLEKIRIAVGDLTAILDDFLSVEKIDSSKVLPVLYPFDLTVLAAEVIADMAVLLKPEQTIKHRHTGTGTVLNLDKKMLKHCLINLVSNATKYSGTGARIELNSVIHQNHCYIYVRDNGIGIPQEDQKQLFTAFFRAANTSNIQGTGLGLNIVKRYTELMNGKIKMKSAEDVGTIFMLSFPVNQ